MKKATTPNQLRMLAPYKLAFTLAKHKMPFKSYEAVPEFVKIADPQSQVFRTMASSRNTIANKTVELYDRVICTEVKTKVAASPFWSLTADESTDSAVQEQCGVYARYIDIDQEVVTTQFLSLYRLIGHPNADNIYNGIMEVIGRNSFISHWRG